MKLAIIGDVHHAWNEVDTAFFNASDYDALLFVGDIYNFSLQRGLKAAAELAATARRQLENEVIAKAADVAEKLLRDNASAGDHNLHSPRIGDLSSRP